MFVNASYNKLVMNGLCVLSLKTDAFVIGISEFEQARGLLLFDEGFGTWRISADSATFLQQNDNNKQRKMNHDLLVISMFQMKMIKQTCLEYLRIQACNSNG